MLRCATPLLGLKMGRSMPTLAAESSSSGLPDGDAFFVYAFTKKQRANIDVDEEEQFKNAARHVFSLTQKQLAELLRRGDFIKVEFE